MKPEALPLPPFELEQLLQDREALLRRLTLAFALGPRRIVLAKPPPAPNKGVKEERRRSARKRPAQHG